jgi:chromosome segregation ATPase
MTSTWNELRSGMGGLFKTIDRRADKLSSCAAIRLKLSAARAELEEEYTTLGKLTYLRAYAAVDTIELDAQDNATDEPSSDEQIAVCVARIDELCEQIAALEAKAKKYGCKSC